MPMTRVRSRRGSDHKLLLLVGLCGLVLIAAPIVVFSQVIDKDDTPAVSGVVQGSQGQPTRVSPLPGAPAQLDGSGRLMLVARDQDGSVVRNFQSATPGAQSSGWTVLGGNAAGMPVAMMDARGEMAVFVVGTNGNLRYNSRSATGADLSAAWRDLGGGHLAGMPAVAQDAQGRLVLVARTADGRLREIQQE